MLTCTIQHLTIDKRVILILNIDPLPIDSQRDASEWITDKGGCFLSIYHFLNKVKRREPCLPRDAYFLIILVVKVVGLWIGVHMRGTVSYWNHTVAPVFLCTDPKGKCRSTLLLPRLNHSWATLFVTGRRSSRTFPGDQASHPGLTSHPSEEVHFDSFYLRPHTFGHDSEVMNIGE